MAAARYPQQRTLLAIVFLLNGTEFLQSGMIAFGASAIMGQISASPEEFVLATVVYAAVAIMALSLQRWCVERVGWRAFVRLSVVAFVAGAGLCASSSTFGQFLAGRAVMALGGAGFMTAARVLINLIPPSPERMKGIGAFGLALALGNALAPWIAAVSTEADLWGIIFAAPAALAMGAALLAGALPDALIPAPERTQTTPWLALAILCASLSGLYGLHRAAFDFYDDATLLAACIAISLALAALVLVHQYRHARPLLHVRTLLQPRYVAGLFVFGMCYVILGANNTMLPVLLQRAMLAPWVAIGAVQTLGLLAAVVAFSAMLAVLRRSPSPRKFYVAGFACLFYFAWQLARLNADASLLRDVLPAIAAFGTFLILVQATTAIQTFTTLQQDAIAFHHGQMIKNMMSQFGTAIGIAIATVVMQWRTTEHWTILAERFNPGDAGFVAARDQLAGSIGAPQAVAELGQLLSQQAALLAGLDYFSALMLVAAVLALLMLTQRIFR